VARVEKGSSAVINERLSPRRTGLDLDYAGLHGQLSESAVGVRRGSEYTLYLGGKGLGAGSVNVFFRSPFVTIEPGSLMIQDFGDGLEAISVIIRISEDAPRGTYSVFVFRPDGSQAALVGGLDVR
jgi:hypothetical protein